MRIAVDTSVWIWHLRDVRTPEVGLLRELLATDSYDGIDGVDIVLGDLVRCEIMRGLRFASDARRADEAFAETTPADFGGHGTANFAARIYRELRDRGITVRSTIDTMIAAWCIQNSCALLHADRDFDHIAAHFPLRKL